MSSARLWLIFAAANAALYACLLPLWEGFDEPFHYAYVETIATRTTLPRPGGGWVARDVEESLKLAPVSAAVRQNLPYSTTYTEYFALDEQKRAARHAELWTMPTEWRTEVLPSSPPNYEAQQTPLAYALLAPFDALGRGRPLAERVLWLRLLCGMAAAMAQAAAALALAREMAFTRASTTLLLTLVTLSQMLYASVAHVANDWLAISLSSWFVVLLVRYVKRPCLKSALILGAITAAGLLTKAYFVAWLAVGLAAIMWKAWRQAPAYLAFALLPAAPAYIRNIVVLGSLSGTMQASAGIGPVEVLKTAFTMPWQRVLPAMARAALWTGNGSFTTFSAATLNVLLALLIVAWGAWIAKKKTTEERALGGAALVFGALLIYACCASYVYRSDAISTSPWYTPAAHLPLAALAAAGLNGAAWWRRAARIGLIAGFSYVLAATYVVKLVPLYGGCDTARMSVSRLGACYGPHLFHTLGQTALAPVGVSAGLAVIVICVSSCLLIRTTMARG